MTRSIFADAEARANRLAAALERALDLGATWDQSHNPVYNKAARELRDAIKGTKDGA